VQTLAHFLSLASGRSVSALPLEGDIPQQDRDRPAGDVVSGASPHFIVFIGGTPYLIHNVSAPYGDDPENVSESIPELRLRKALREHTAWLSMDILHPEAATPEAYRLVARTLSYLVDSDCLALYHVRLGQFALCNSDETIAKLRSDDPVTAVFREITQVPVIPVDEDDPRLKAAEAEARSRFSEFEAAFRNKDGAHFGVKTALSQDGDTEHIWIEVDRISAGKIQGRLANEPVNLGDMKIGAAVQFDIDRVEDWGYMRDGRPVGMFTLLAIEQIQQERREKK